MKRLAIGWSVFLGIMIAASPGHIGTVSLASAQQAAAAGDWTTLFDGKSLDGWRKLGNANWRIVDNYVEANSGSGFLVTPRSYTNFHLKLEFWTDADANSGVFIRSTNPNEVGTASAYEVNIYDKRPDPAYRTGGIVNVASPKVQMDAAGKWNTYEITADGAHFVVKMNGVVTADSSDAKFASGPIALQYGAGTVRFRNVQIQTF